jgi:murein DD-endopeptidase MepM/ murein hydrolase activator NlpD
MHFFKKLLLLIDLLCIPLFVNATQASFLCKCHNVKQGQTIRTQIKSNEILKSAHVTFLSKQYPLVPTPINKKIHECYIPIECEGKTGTFPLIATIQNKKNKAQSLKSNVVIQKRKFPKQKGFKVSSSYLSKKVKKESLVSSKIPSIWGKAYRSSPLLDKLLSESPRKRLWNGRFTLPTKVLRYSTPFGEIRNSSIGWGRYLHKGVDIVSNRRTPVKASQQGKVVIKDRFKASGNSVVIDHGLGVFTYYLHLEEFGNIKVGSHVKKQQLIGTVGNTGYSSGYHLHWGLSVNNELVDPLEWITSKFA